MLTPMLCTRLRATSSARPSHHPKVPLVLVIPTTLQKRCFMLAKHVESLDVSARRAGSIFRCRPCGARPHHGWCQPAGLARPDSSSSQLDSYASSTGYHPSWESELAQDLGSSESEVQDQLKVNSASEV